MLTRVRSNASRLSLLGPLALGLALLVGAPDSAGADDYRRHGGGHHYRHGDRGHHGHRHHGGQGHGWGHRKHRHYGSHGHYGSYYRGYYGGWYAPYAWSPWGPGYRYDHRHHHGCGH
jgi:hypothetical protein